MKKLMTAVTLVLLTLDVCPQTGRWYDGPKDDIYWATRSEMDYNLALHNTSLGQLARYSDVIGVGLVSGKTNNQVTVTIDHALVGCTNGAAIVVYASPDWGEEPNEYMLEDYFPTNMGRIVFAACTNFYATSSRMYWNHPEIPVEPEYIYKYLSLRYLNRSWWYADRDDGLLFTQFTNVLQAVRFDQNWTNYFYLCRDGANSLSNRVREDSFKDLRVISLYSTDERAQFILDDPLVDPRHKTMILIPDWRCPNENF